jgi:hypothetical protein
MKKAFGVSAFLLSMLTFVSAQSNAAAGLSKGMSQVIGMIEGMLGPLFSAILGGGSEMLFEKILFLIIIFAIVYIIIKRTPVFSGDKNKPIVWIVSISVSLLSTRFMSGDLLKSMMLPYTTLGVTLTAALPLIIFFIFVLSFDKPEHKTLRKILWIAYIVVFTTIWSTRYNDIGVISYIYLGSAIVALIFLLADGTIRRHMIKQKIEGGRHDRRMVMIADIERKVEETMKHPTLDDATKANMVNRFKKQLKELSKW